MVLGIFCASEVFDAIVRSPALGHLEVVDVDYVVHQAGPEHGGVGGVPHTDPPLGQEHQQLERKSSYISSHFEMTEYLIYNPP